MIQYVIFDVDGTLIDTEIAIRKSLQKALLEESGKEYDSDSLDFIFGIPGKDALEQLGIKEIDRVLQKWDKYMEDYKGDIKVFEGIEAVLNLLKGKNIGIGVVTSKTRAEFDHDFPSFGLMKYLNHIVCADDTAKHKPNPEPILKFLEKAGIKSQEAIYIGDTAYDCKAAKGANVKFALALWGARNPDSIDADYKLVQPQDVMSAFA